MVEAALALAPDRNWKRSTFGQPLIARRLAAARVAHYTDGSTEMQNERIAAYLERAAPGADSRKD